MAKNIRKRFGDRVRELRLSAGLSQEQVAARAKLSRHYLSEVESGRRNPSIEVVARIAFGLRVSLPELTDF